MCSAAYMFLLDFWREGVKDFEIIGFRCRARKSSVNLSLE